MRSTNFKSFLIKSGFAASLYVLAGGASFAQQQVNLTAAPATANLPDGSAVPMWGYYCGAAVSGSTATCSAGSTGAGQWAPVVITVPTGADLQINLTNNLSFTPAGATAANNVPTSIVIVGQLGGGLGDATQRTTSPSPTHGPQSVTWSTVGNSGGAQFTPPVQPDRVQSFATEVAAVPASATPVSTSLTWKAPRPGTYLIESGTHPSIQGPMGLYGVLVVTAAPTLNTAGGEATPGTAYPGVSYDGEVPIVLSEIDPIQNNAVGVAVNSAGFNENAVIGLPNPVGSVSVSTSGGTGYNVGDIFSITGGGGSGGTAQVSSVDATGAITGLTLTNGGSGYTSVPTNIALISSNGATIGTGAQLAATLAYAGDVCSNGMPACYPPAVNYTPKYYLMNGVAFDKTNAAASLFAATPASLLPASTTGPLSVLVRFVNAGLRMHVPAIVGSQTGTAPVAGATVPTGFTLIAEDGNPLPGIPRVQSEVFMAAGKTYDVMINAPSLTAPALPVFDRELSLSGNATSRDAGMLAYISINAAGLPTNAPALQGAVANPDTYNSVIAGHTFSVSDPSKGVIANDVNVYGVTVSVAAAHGTVTLASNGTFTYVPDATWAAATSPTTIDTFTYCGNKGTPCALVTLNAATIETGGITVGPSTFTSNIATYLNVPPPGILAAAKDAGGYPLTVAPGSVAGWTGPGILAVNPDGSFSVSGIAPPGSAASYTFSYAVQNSQGSNSQGTAAIAPCTAGATGCGTVTVNFQAASGLVVTLIDGKSGQPVGGSAANQDYRWIIEEDRTFYVDPACQVNPPPAGCPGAPGGALNGIVPTYGTNFHTSDMPFVAQGCTGPLSCESGQTVYDPTSGAHVPAVCDIGNGACRPDITGFGHTPVLPGSAYLDPTKRYYISILPGNAATPFSVGYTGTPCTGTTSASCAIGYGMGGAPISGGQTAVNVTLQASPYPPGELSVFVFEDDFPLNGEVDSGGGVDVLAPNEPGLGGFQIHLWDAMGGNGDFTGQMSYDMFNQPLSNGLDGYIDPATGLDACPITKLGLLNSANGGITGMIVTCPKYEGDGTKKILSPLAGQAIIKNLMPGRFGVIATPGADRIARGEEWHQTNTLDGQKAHDSFIRIAEPGYFQEYGPASYHVTIGFANPAIINARLPGICNGTDINIVGYTGGCGNSIVGQVTTERMSRTPDERLYSSGSHQSFYWTQCYVSVGDPDGEDFAFAKCDADGKFKLTGLPNGQWRVTVFDQWNDALVDGLSTPVSLGPIAATGLGSATATSAVCPGKGSTTSTTGPNVCDMGDIATNQWQMNIYTKTFLDKSGDGVAQADEDGIPLIPVAVRYRDGSLSNNLMTDFTGTANFNETFPLFNWYVVETDVTRYKNTGTHSVYDAGGPADGSVSCGSPTNQGYPNCGTSSIGVFLANTNETVPVPADLRVPGAKYCKTADCLSGDPGFDTGGVGTKPYDPTVTGSTGRVDPPWLAGTEGVQGYSGQNNFLEFGKAPYSTGENGGIRGHVVYASTRPFDDPQMLVQTQWEPLIPHVTINLYQEGTAADGSPSLTLVDTTQTSSWDDWAQGFHAGPNGTPVPNMSCPGQTLADLFFFTLAGQPQYLDLYNNVLHPGGTGTTTPVPYNSQFKCYDGMHNWNQLEPAPYDGMYQFPSITKLDPVTGKPAGTNCTICSATPNPSKDMYGGLPMLPAGKYVVEVVVPTGYELVKEEDKNILIGDDFIAPATQQFGSLSNIFIIPDQASVASAYNANNAQNPTNSLGAQPSTSTVPAFPFEPTWPCVGQARIVPDYISLFPQTKQVAPFAGATRNLCDRKEVTLTEQSASTAKFYLYTSTHRASKFTGIITDDFTSEFDPFSPQFGEKFSPPNMPVAVKDWTGAEISRVYSDQWGDYNGMVYSTWEVNPPNPTGYAPNMMVMCMNDPGTGATPDPLFNPLYSQFCYELPYMPAQTQYLDTPVVPTAGFVGSGYNTPDCAYPDATPAVSEVDGDGVGPWVKNAFAPVSAIQVSGGGSGYASAPQVAINGAGSGATAKASITLSTVATVHVSNGGVGYSSAPAVAFTGAGSGATATAALTYGVGKVTVSNGGTGYAGNTQVTFGGGGTGATAKVHVNRNGKIIAVDITNPGTGYTSPVSVTFTRTGFGRGAAATATVSGTVTSVTVNAGGTGYTSAPSVTFSGGGGSGAKATSAVTGFVNAVTVSNGGGGYSPTSPTVAFSGGGGSGAVASATVGTGGLVTITGLGNQSVNNYSYSGPSATQAPFNQKKVTRHYGFGAQCTTPTAGSATCNVPSSVTIGGVPASIVSWSDTSIAVNVPAGIPACAVQQQPQYKGSFAQCGELVITAGNGQKSIDAVTVTVGGSAPTIVSSNAPMTQSGPGAIQQAIDAANPGDLIIIPPGQYQEMLLMWKPVRLQGVGAASSVINANTQPAGKLDPWRHQVNCLFGLATNGVPIASDNPFDSAKQGVSCGSTNGTPWTGFSAVMTGTKAAPLTQKPQVDRLPLEGIVGWDTTTNGNLAQLLQEPTLMGAYEGAGITVLSKGVNTKGLPGYYGSGAEATFPTGSVVLTAGDCGSSVDPTNPDNPYPSNFQCNPSSIDGLSVTDSSQGGGAVFVHAWGHNLQIANDRIYNNIGTLAGGLNIGQGESPDAYLAGTTTDTDPGSCETSTVNNEQLPYCFDMYVNVHNNLITANESIGDELFSGTPAGAGGASFCTGADYYQFNYNWVCGNMSTGDGGGLAHIGFIKNGDIEHNSILFNQSTNPTIATNGGGIVIMGAAPDGFTAAGIECGNSAADADCAPGLPDGTGPNLVINANLILGNAASSGSGGGLRLQSVNGTEVSLFPKTPGQWNTVNVTNNIIVNNVAGWDGGGVSLQDALAVNLINNTIASNDTTASAGVLFNTLGAPLASAPGASNQTTSGTTSAPQPAGLVTMQNSTNLTATFAGLTLICPQHNPGCATFSNPYLANDLFFQNRAFQIGVGTGIDAAHQQHIVSLYNAAFGSTTTGSAPASQSVSGACVAGSSFWDLGARGDSGPGNHGSGITLAPMYSGLTNASETGAGSNNLVATNPNLVSQYCNGSRTPPEAANNLTGWWKLAALGWQVPPGISDATVPNPIFNLSPNATVDEGNNWVNISWGPLALANPSGTTLGNYTLAAGSPAIDAIPGSASTYAVAPSTDFFGNPRPDTASKVIDIGAVEFQGQAVAIGRVSGTLAFGNVIVNQASAAQTLTLANDGGATLTYTVTPTAPYSVSGGTCNGTLLANSTCTIKVVFTPTAAGPAPGTVTIAGNTPVIGSPVQASGTGVIPTYTATVSASSLTFSTGVAVGTPSAAQTLTIRNTGTGALSGGTFTFAGAYARSTTAAGSCTAALAVGSSCTLNVVFAPTALGSNSGTLTVAYTDGVAPAPAATVTNSLVTLSGTGVAPIVTATLTPTNWTPSWGRFCPGGNNFFARMLCAMAPAQRFTFTNTGNVNLTVGPGVLAGTGTNAASNVANYVIINTFGGFGTTCGVSVTTLAPNATCTVSVQFKALASQAAGVKAATLSVTGGNGLTQTTPMATLNGNGQ